MQKSSQDMTLLSAENELILKFFLQKLKNHQRVQFFLFLTGGLKTSCFFLNTSVHVETAVVCCTQPAQAVFYIFIIIIF